MKHSHCKVFESIVPVHERDAITVVPVDRSGPHDANDSAIGRLEDLVTHFRSDVHFCEEAGVVEVLAADHKRPLVAWTRHGVRWRYQLNDWGCVPKREARVDFATVEFQNDWVATSDPRWHAKLNKMLAL